MFKNTLILNKLTWIQLNKTSKSGKNRIPKKEKCLVKALNKCPQKLGTVVRVFEQAPKKPNSAKRKVAKVKLKHTGRYLSAHLPGEGHNLTKHSTILIRGGRCQDLIGVRYKPIRGVESFSSLENRITRLSKYGVKKKPRFITARETYKENIIEYIKKINNKIVHKKIETLNEKSFDIIKYNTFFLYTYNIFNYYKMKLKQFK
jgi:small subunit ribosomal protein S12